MSRNDSILYGGSTANYLEKRKLQTEEKKERRSKLLPVADIVLEAITKEREETELELLKMVNLTTPKKNVERLLDSLNLYDKSMIKLSNKFKNILRDTNKPELEEDEDGDAN